MNVAIWVAAFLGALAWSGHDPVDPFIWWLEAIPALALVIVLAVTRRSFPLSPLAYALLLAYAVLTMIGAHYTYPAVPLFDRLREAFDLSRNYFDKVGHFAQGFVPAIVIREILRRKDVVNGRRALPLLVVCCCLAISATYELLEWGVAVGFGSEAKDFLGDQGYVWDPQADMLTALLGALAAVGLLSEFHDRQLARMSVAG